MRTNVVLLWHMRHGSFYRYWRSFSHQLDDNLGAIVPWRLIGELMLPELAQIHLTACSHLACCNVAPLRLE